jgi:signal transduction histidine kinase
MAGARGVVSPIRELTEAIRSLGQRGAAVDRVPVRTRDEVGALAREFNRMASDLDRARQELVDAAKFAFAGELAAGIAHEIRTPLGVLRTSSQILERSLPPGQDTDTVELVQMMRAEVDRVDRVVTELLNLARPRDARIEPIALAEAVFRAADFVEPQASEKGITIGRADSGGHAVVWADPELIFQVALNLLVNAIQVLPRRGRIEVRILPHARGLGAFEVRDDGPGIPDDVHERIFQPFVAFREGGTGLGLTFVQRVVQEHRGRITLESTVGSGTTFRVELPTAEAAR